MKKLTFILLLSFTLLETLNARSKMGEKIYDRHCLLCHGSAPTLLRVQNKQQWEELFKDGIDAFVIVHQGVDDWEIPCGFRNKTRHMRSYFRELLKDK